MRIVRLAILTMLNLGLTLSLPVRALSGEPEKDSLPTPQIVPLFVYGLDWSVGTGRVTREPKEGKTVDMTRVVGRMYFGLLGITPTFEVHDYRGIEALSRSVQLLGSLRFETLNHRLQIEPIVGYEWHRMKGFIGDTRSQGIVLGVDQSVGLTERTFVRGLFTYVDLPEPQQRYTVELRWWSFWKRDWESLIPASQDSGFGAIGFHLDQGGPNRRDYFVTLGLGVMLGR